MVIVLPQSMIEQIFKQYHTDSGHHSGEKTYLNITQKYYIFDLLNQLKLRISRCSVCLELNQGGIGNVPPQQIQASRINEKLFLDVIGKLSMESSEGCSFVLVGIDAFSRYGTAHQLPDIRGPSIVRSLKLMYIYKHSYPEQIISDNGLNSPELTEFCQLNSIKLTFIAAYNPRSNLTERLNKSLKAILYKLYNDRYKQWDEETLSLAVFSYNISIHNSTGYSPQYIFTGTQPTIPLDLFLENKNVKRDTQTSYLEDLRQAIANVPLNAYEAFKNNYNLSGNRKFERNNDLIAGDKILVRNFRKTSKFDPNFIKNFEIVKKISNGTYLVKNNVTKRYSKLNVRDIKKDLTHPSYIDTSAEDEIQSKTDRRKQMNLKPYKTMN